MAADGGTVELTYKAKLDQLERDMAGVKAKVGRHADDTGDDFSKRFTSKLGAAGKLAGKALVVGLAAATVAVGAFGASAIGAASDQAESLSKSNTIFGENAKEMEKWAATAAKSFGQSKTQALENSASFGNMFTQLGIGGDKAADMSKSMVELASDFASFHNADISEVLVAQQAAFRGEYDAVQRFVPTINAATVEQKALSMGLAGSTKELTAQHKALATQALLMEGAGAAMGDYDRTSKGWANRMREMKARWEDFKASAGAPIMGAALAALNAVESAGSRVVAAFALIRSGFLEGNVSESSGFMGFLVNVGIAAKVMVAGLVSAFAFLRDDVFPVIANIAGFVQGNFLPVLVAVGVVVVTAVVPAFIAWATAAGAAAIATITAAAPLIALAALLGALAFAVVYAYQHFETFRAIVDGVASFLVSVVSAAFNYIATVVTSAIDIITGVIKLGLALIRGDWSGAWEAVKGILSAAWNAIIDVIQAQFRVVNALFAGLPGQILGALGNLGSLLYQAGRDLIMGMVNGIKSMAGALADAAKSVASGAVNAVKGFLGIGSPSKLFMGFGVNVGQGLAIGMERSVGLVAGAGDVLASAAGGYGSSLNMSSMGHSGSADSSSSGGRPINVGPFYVRENDLPTEIPRRLRGALHLWDR